MTPPERPARADDDAYVVDTRNRPSGQRGGRPKPDADDAYVVDTRHRPPARRGGVPAADPDAEPARRPRRRRGRLVALLVGLLVLAWLAFMVWVPYNAWNDIARVDATPSGDRPTGGKGTNFLLVGSDSRQGLTEAQKKEFGATNAAGARTDSIILVHVSDSGNKPLVISLPRDSYVPIPGYRKNKINAAYALGGPKLLTATVENATGLTIDGYLEIGFGGFASVVDSLDGVDICVPFNMKDPEAGINLKKGCQTLDGHNALGFVRTRHTDPRGDLGRADRQRQFLAAVMKKAVSPGTVLVPWRYKGFADSMSRGLILGRDTTMGEALAIFQAMRSVSNGDGISATVPIADPNYTTYAGSSVKWDSAKASELFRMIKDDESLTSVPKGAGN
ncbi:LCP family protein [Terrabacter lapilli]|uniref:LCP family protein n=1 Tax=Terrabacter lapilli TaxID=436231 RepID=A0ABP5E196_9MICO|nr:LCP family protein [Terrabacter sp.]